MVWHQGTAPHLPHGAGLAWTGHSIICWNCALKSSDTCFYSGGDKPNLIICFTLWNTYLTAVLFFNSTVHCAMPVFSSSAVADPSFVNSWLWWLNAIFPLTLKVRGPSYLGLTRSISWLLMPWLLTSPGHQQPWYWLCRIGRFLSYLRKDFNYLRCINMEKWHKM